MKIEKESSVRDNNFQRARTIAYGFAEERGSIYFGGWFRGGKSDKSRGPRCEGAAQIAVSYISQLFDNAADTEPGGSSLELKMSSAVIFSMFILAS